MDSELAGCEGGAIPVERIERRIYVIRGHKVMLDSDLARLYCVTTFNLNKAVKRNPGRFPADFMFQLTRPENEALTFQIGISNKGVRGGRRYLPYAFTEHGVAMLSSVLRSDRAIQVNIAIMRAFSRLRELLSTHKELARRLDELETRYDARFKEVFDAIRALMEKPAEPIREKIGFHPRRDASGERAVRPHGRGR
jgi:hypothetical protein